LKLPALQLRQAELPVDVWKVPAGQRLHVETSPPDEIVPSMHLTQAKFRVYSPATQLSGAQEEAPVWSAPKPLAQPVQVDAPAPE
jgi:hypothetical protein